MREPVPPHLNSVDVVDKMRTALNTALRGKPRVVELVLACLLARGHLLLEDLPGLGKTTLAKAMATAIGGTFARVQCTPDLLPGDVTGFSIFNQKSSAFEFVRGPVFSDVLLVDEINRATPRTQSSLLEAMAELQVTVDNVGHPLSDTFFVIATQNPIEQYGTYPLPEAQLDRFAMKLRIGYPDKAAEMEMLAGVLGHCCERDTPHQKLLVAGQLHWLQEEVASVSVAPSIREYLVNLAHTLRRHPSIPMGLSPRALLIWQRAAQAWAYLSHRSYVVPDDVKAVAVPILAVRIGMTAAVEQKLIDEAINAEAVPLPSTADFSR